MKKNGIKKKRDEMNEIKLKQQQKMIKQRRKKRQKINRDSHKKDVTKSNIECNFMDECSELIRKIEERERIEGALVIKREKETGALIMIEIEGKMMKSLTDSGAYLTVMAIEWAKYLGIENKIDKTQVPKETNGVMENRVKFLGRV